MSPKLHLVVVALGSFVAGVGATALADRKLGTPTVPNPLLGEGADPLLGESVQATMSDLIARGATHATVEDVLSEVARLTEFADKAEKLTGLSRTTVCLLLRQALYILEHGGKPATKEDETSD
jgi:hypothetical protein